MKYLAPCSQDDIGASNTFQGNKPPGGSVNQTQKKIFVPPQGFNFQQAQFSKELLFDRMTGFTGFQKNHVQPVILSKTKAAVKRSQFSACLKSGVDAGVSNSNWNSVRSLTSKQTFEPQRGEAAQARKEKIRALSCMIAGNK